MDEALSSLLELPSFAGGSADEVVEATAPVSRSNFRLSRVIVRASCSSRTEPEEHCKDFRAWRRLCSSWVASGVNGSCSGACSSATDCELDERFRGLVTVFASS